jgi:hypothetical protein
MVRREAFASQPPRHGRSESALREQPSTGCRLRDEVAPRPTRAPGDRTGWRVNVGGIGATCRLGESSTGRPERARVEKCWPSNAAVVDIGE